MDEPLSEQVGIIQESETYEERKLEWKISNVSSIIDSERENIYRSPPFSFAETLWYFELFQSPVIPYNMKLYLWKVYDIKYSVKYKFSVKNLNGSLENIGGGILKAGEKVDLRSHHRMKKSEIKQRKLELAPSDVLTITCILIRGIPVSPEPSVLDSPKLEEPKNLEGLSQSFKDLFANKESCDTILWVQEKMYKAHRLVLVARSSVFSAMFRHDMSENHTGIITIHDCDPDSFQGFLEYLYCGQLDDISFTSAFHLYSTSHKYDVQDLKAFCAEYLIRHLTVKNVCSVVIMADFYDDTKLFSAAQDFFNKNMNKIFDTTDWQCLLKDNFRLATQLLKQMSCNVIVIN